MAFFSVLKKIHWSDGDAAGIAWFPNYFGWFEDAEEELFAAALGRSRHSLLEGERFGMPRVEANIRYEAPVRIGSMLRIGIDVGFENPRRLRYTFEMWDVADERRVAHGFVRVGCVNLADFTPRDFPADVLAFARRIQELANDQTGSGVPLPWA
jgi:acyl-CoA thioester hydrolase